MCGTGKEKERQWRMRAVMLRLGLEPSGRHSHALSQAVYISPTLPIFAVYMVRMCGPEGEKHKNSSCLGWGLNLVAGTHIMSPPALGHLSNSLRYSDALAAQLQQQAQAGMMAVPNRLQGPHLSQPQVCECVCVRQTEREREREGGRERGVKKVSSISHSRLTG
jgi:hypothetical protein